MNMPMQGGMPPQGAAPQPGHGQGMAQQLMQLVQSSPKAQQMLAQVIGQLTQGGGMGPQAQMGMPMPQQAGPMPQGGPSGGGMPMPQEMPQDMPMPEEGMDEMPDEVPAGPKGQPSTEDELAAVSAEIDGGDWEGTPDEGPTEQDIAMVKEDPSLMASFVKFFGEEALGGGMDEEANPGETEPDNDEDDY